MAPAKPKPKRRKNPAAVALGRKSARSRLGKLSREDRAAAMRELVERRWAKRKEKA